MPEVSFIIINYNTFDLSCNCISSIIKKVKDITYEIVLVDNASSEVNPDLFTKRFPNIKLIKSDKNLGFSKGNNLGISHSSGNNICLINSDAEILEGSLVEAIKFLRKGETSFLTGKLVYPDGRIQHNCQSFPSALKNFIEWSRLHKLLPKNYRSKFMQGFYFDYSSPGSPDWVWGTFMLFEKSLLGLFDKNKLPEDFFMYGEDMDWCFKASKFNLHPLYIPDIKILHHLGQSKGHAEAQIIQNRKTFLKNNYNRFHRRLLELC